MIENLVDNAIASLLRTISGLTVYIGMQSDDNDLKAPYCVVYSNIQNFTGRSAIYQLVTHIEYYSISGVTPADSVVSVITSIDNLLIKQPSSNILNAINTSGLQFLAWEEIAQSSQEVGEKRKNTRELQVLAQLS